MSITRRRVVSTGFAVALPAIRAARAVAAPVRWQLATASLGTSVIARNLRQFADDVREGTQQGLVVELHPASSLRRQSALWQGVRAGEVQLAEFQLAREAALDPIFEVDAIPRLVRDENDGRRLAALSRPFLERRLQREGVTLLSLLPSPPGGLYTGFMVDSLAMLRGTRMRVRTMMGGRFAMLLGATPAPLDANEVEAGFAARVANAMFGSASMGVDLQAWSFSRYFTAFDLNLPGSGLIVQSRALDALPVATREAVRAAASAAEERAWVLAASERDAALPVLEQNGMVLQRSSPAMEQELRHASSVILQEWLARAGEHGRRLIEAYSKG